VSKPLDPASANSGKKRGGPKTLEEFTEELRRSLGPRCRVSMKHTEPKTDGPIIAKFFFVNRSRNPDTPTG
jgi:hypothetical protein